MRNKAGEIGLLLAVLAAFLGALIVSHQRAWAKQRRIRRAARLQQRVLQQLERMPE